ncbi:hypothetical protein BCV69DRAFT_298800 [Microstroma glucosiphilum]|uniref:Uncharacterized protein n=1 Tax=Pseudomicrostroma glucosiphilum TaxID=1684307 RepID=A0A316U6V1_9BASI|nr:hypothetical protein BCV69DRAFT_298800 [Pseudomicrostroma glucosiphilum]PWN21007.1 hypothetical protein BCV69DRAFT_298800 [Pseudomicrostroma glucosiphilum]
MLTSQGLASVSSLVSHPDDEDKGASYEQRRPYGSFSREAQPSTTAAAAAAAAGPARGAAAAASSFPLARAADADKKRGGGEEGRGASKQTKEDEAQDHQGLSDAAHAPHRPPPPLEAKVGAALVNRRRGTPSSFYPQHNTHLSSASDSPASPRKHSPSSPLPNGSADFSPAPPPLPARASPFQRFVSSPPPTNGYPRSKAFKYRPDTTEADFESAPQSKADTKAEFRTFGLRGLAKRAASIAGFSYPSQADSDVPPVPSLTELPRGLLTRNRRQEQRSSGNWISPSPSGLRPITLGLASSTSASGYGSTSHSRSASVSSSTSRSSRLTEGSSAPQTRSAPATVESTPHQRAESTFGTSSSAPARGTLLRSPCKRESGSVFDHHERDLESSSSFSDSSSVSCYQHRSREDTYDSPPSLWKHRESITSTAERSSGPPTDSDDSADKRDSITSATRGSSLYTPSALQIALAMPPKATANGRAAAGTKSKAEAKGKAEPKKDKRDSTAPTPSNGDAKNAKRRSISTNTSGSGGAAESEDSDAEGFEDAEGGAGEEREDAEEPAGEETAEAPSEEPGPSAQESGATGSLPAVETLTVDPTQAEGAEQSASPLPEADEASATTPLTARPPPPPPRPVAAASPSTPTARKNSTPSLWDRLKTPQERAAEAALKSPSPPPAASSTVTAPQLQQRQLSSGSLLNSLTSAANYAASSAASRGFNLPERLGGGAAAAASLAQGPLERKRLPRYEVDEGKMMEDQMRFAEARHLLATSTQLEQVRSLGKDLEGGWREKLAEVTELHLKLEDLTASVSDIQDENEQLRTQLASLSEQIALREEDFEAFQRLTIAHQEREKELWVVESQEEKERLEWKEREAVRILAEERAINAQLRLVLLGSLNGAATEEGGGGASSNASSSGLVRDSGLIEKNSSHDSAGSSRRSAVFDVADGDGEELERGGPRDRDPSGGEEGAIQDDVLFNLNLPHTASGGRTTPGAGGGAGGSAETGMGTANRSAVASLFSDVVPLDQLRLILKMPPAEEEEAAQRILSEAPPSGAAGMTPSASQSSLREQENSTLTTSSSNGALGLGLGLGLGSSNSSKATHALSHPSVQQTLTSQKSLADYQLSQALQLENLSIRSQLRDANRRAGLAEEEVKGLKEKVRGMEEAVSGLLEGGGFAGFGGAGAGAGKSG